MGLQGPVLGHNKQIETIERTIKKEKVPHSYLFVGIDGIGKRLVATKLAQALQCNAEDDKPCNNCMGCRKTAEGNHPDVIFVEAEGKIIKIEQIRELQKKLAYKPFEGRATVCIIDGADKMNISAGNALLKTLEEPPSSSYLILLAENMRKVIPTVISRCQRIKFNPLPKDIIAEILIREKGLSTEEAGYASRLGEGSPGKAAVFMECFSLPDREKLLSDFFNLSDIANIFSIAEEATKKNETENLPYLLETLKLFIRDMIFLKTGMGKERMINFMSMALIEDKAENYSTPSLLEMAEAVSRAEYDLSTNVNKRLAIENMLLNFYNNRAGSC